MLKNVKNTNYISQIFEFYFMFSFLTMNMFKELVRSCLSYHTCRGYLTMCQYESV
jgi:flagellar biosynthesis protein FliR